MPDTTSAQGLVGDGVRLASGSLAAGTAVFAVASALFLSLTSESLLHSDAAAYAQCVRDYRLSETSIHVGYYIAGIPFGRMFAVRTDLGLNLMNALFGGLLVALIFLVATLMCGRRLGGAVAALLVLANYLFAVNAVHAEVYAGQAALFMLAVLLAMLGRPVWAGVACASSVLFSPSSLLGVPFLILLLRSRRSILWFLLVCGGVVALPVVPFVHDYLFGARGLLGAATRPIVPLFAVRKEFRELSEGFLFVSLLLPVGLAALVRREVRGVSLLLLAVLWSVPFLFGEKYGDVPAQLPSYGMLCALTGAAFACYWRAGSKRFACAMAAVAWAAVLVAAFARFWGKPHRLAVCMPLWVPASLALMLALLTSLSLGTAWRERLLRVWPGAALAVVLVLNGFCVSHYLSKRREEAEAYRDASVRLPMLARPDYLFVADNGRGILFEYHVWGRSYTGRWINTEWLEGDSWGRELHDRSQAEWREALHRGREVWMPIEYPAICEDLRAAGYCLARQGLFLKAEKRTGSGG